MKNFIEGVTDIVLCWVAIFMMASAFVAPFVIAWNWLLPDAG